MARRAKKKKPATAQLELPRAAPPHARRRPPELGPAAAPRALLPPPAPVAALVERISAETVPAAARPIPRGGRRLDAPPFARAIARTVDPQGTYAGAHLAELGADGRTAKKVAKKGKRKAPKKAAASKTAKNVAPKAAKKKGKRKAAKKAARKGTPRLPAAPSPRGLLPRKAPARRKPSRGKAAAARTRAALVRFRISGELTARPTGKPRKRG